MIIINRLYGIQSNKGEPISINLEHPLIISSELKIYLLSESCVSSSSVKV